MDLIAIDPGTEQSGLVRLSDGLVVEADVFENSVLLERLREPTDALVVIEMISSYGMAVGQETFETVMWIGRFLEAVEPRGRRLFRKDIKLHHCHSSRAKDANIWQSILDRYGGKDKAVGKKAAPGPLYGVTSHARAALAVAICWMDGVRSEGL